MVGRSEDWAVLLIVFQEYVTSVGIRMQQEIFCDVAIVAGLILQAFRRRTFAKVVVARQAGIAGEQRLARPHVVVAYRVTVRFFEPRMILVARGQFRVVHRKDHGRQERRLRAAEVVAAIGIQNLAVLRDLKKEILNHPAGQFDASIAHQAANNEIAVPPVHFVESSAGNNVRVFEI